MGLSGEAGSSRLRCLWVAGGGVPWALPSLLWVIRSRQGISKQGGRTRASRHVSSVQRYSSENRHEKAGSRQKAEGWEGPEEPRMEGSTAGRPETPTDPEGSIRAGRETACFTAVLGVSGSPAAVHLPRSLALRWSQGVS